MAGVTVREACAEDCENIFRLSNELVLFENITSFKGTIESYQRDGFGVERRFYCIVAEDENDTKSGKPTIIGFLLYAKAYVIGMSKYALHIEQIFLTEKNRRQGVGSAMLNKALEIVTAKGFCRAQLVVRNANTAAMKYYQKMGAINATESLGLNVISLFDDKIKENVEEQNKYQLTGRKRSLILIRDACKEDCEQILEMMKALAVYEEDTARFEVDAESFCRDGFGEEKLFHCLVAEDERISDAEKPRLVGFLLYTWVYKAYLISYSMYIESFFVHEKYRNQGIGTVLFEQALKVAYMKGCCFIQLFIRKYNTATMKFCQKFGVVDESEEKDQSFMLFENRLF